MAYDTDMTWTLGKNNKGDNPRRPDYRGELIFGGKTYLLSGWIRENKAKGTKFISGRMQLKEEKQRADSGRTDSAAHDTQSQPLNDDPFF